VKSKLGFRGHPFHVIYVDFPIALWIGSLLADVLHMWRGPGYWSRVSWHLMAAGIAFAALAAVPGIVDYFKSVPPGSEARKVARTHGLLNGGIVALYAVNLWWRAEHGIGQGGSGVAAGGEWWLALGLSAVGVALLTYTGWLGGELVYRYQIGTEKVGVEGRPTLYGGSTSASPGSYVEVASEDELGPGQLKHVVVNGTWMAIARTGEGFHAIDELCTHEGGPLCDGTLVGTMVQCPWHGSRFDVRTGAVEAGPARTPLRTFPVRVEGGRVMVEAPEG
jgi:nitrite reductase/ring-hydroxylating ferredoxin subunit/uncharacterized membrane protein